MIEYICSFEEEYGFLVSASMKYGEELIRCKDCKWNKSSGDWIDCPMSGMFGRKASDNYCSLAERKREESE